MGDRPMTTEQVASALAALSSELAYPATPSMRSAVTARLENERAAGARPGLPRGALASRGGGGGGGGGGARGTPGLPRVIPPTAPHPPVHPDALGDPAPAREASALPGFEPFLPSGP